jgi:hypothetical protein
VPTHQLPHAVGQHQWLAQRVAKPILSRMAPKATPTRLGQRLLLLVDHFSRQSLMLPCEPRLIRSVSKINHHHPRDRLFSIEHHHLGHSPLPLYRVEHSILIKHQIYPKTIPKLCQSHLSSCLPLSPTRIDLPLYYYRVSNWDHSSSLQKLFRHYVPHPASRVPKRL